MANRSVQFTVILQRFDSQLWGHHFVVPDEIAEPFVASGSRRVVCTLFGKEQFQCALMARGEVLESAPPGKYFINLNKETRDKFHLRVGAELQVALEPDESKYGLPMPDEMAELLAQDPDADHLFHALTPGKQRSLLYIVGKPKTAETRLTKAIVIVEHLKVNEGKLDFKQLNEDFKRGRDW